MTGRTLVGTGAYSSEFHFKNFLKGATSLNTSAGYAYPSALGSNGLPVSTPTQEITAVAKIPNSYSGNWVYKHTGNMRVRLAPSNGGTITVVSGSGFVVSGGTNTITIGGVNARVEMTWTACPQVQVVFCNVGTVASPSNMVLCRSSSPYTGDEAAIDGGVLQNMFNDDYITELTTLNPQVIRFHEFEGLNNSPGSNLSRYAYWTPTGCFSYQAERWPPGAWVGTIGGTDTYTCGASTDSTALVDGTMIQGQFTNANTGTTPTLNFNGTGAKAIVRSTIFSISAGQISANLNATLVYDAILDKWMLWQSGMPAPMIPISMACALANKVGCDMWFNVPHLTDDAGVTSIISEILGALDSTKKLYLELSNEVWNTVYGHHFWGTNRAAVMGFSASGGRDYMAVFGKRHCEVMALASAAWLPRTDLQRVLAFQAYGSTTNIPLYYCQGSDLSAYGFNSAPNRPIDRCEVMSYAPYYAGAQCMQFSNNYANTMTTDGPVGNAVGLLGAADQYALGDPANQTLALDWMDWDFRQGTLNGTLGTDTLKYQHDTILPAWKTIIDGYSKKLVCYEDGFGAIGPTTAKCTALGINTKYGNVFTGALITTRGTIQLLLDAYKADQRFLNLVAYKLNMMAGGATLTVVPTWLQLAEGLQNNWGVSQSDLYSARFKSWDAMVLFNARKRRLVVKT